MDDLGHLPPPPLYALTLSGGTGDAHGPLPVKEINRMSRLWSVEESLAWDFKPKVSKLYQGLKLKSQNFQKLKKIEEVQSVLVHNRTEPDNYFDLTATFDDG